LPRFDGPVLISDMRILGPPLTPHPMAAIGRFCWKSPRWRGCANQL